MEYLGIGTSIVKTLHRHKSLPIKLLASFEGSDPDQLVPYLHELQRSGVVRIEGDRVVLDENTATAVKQGG
jgi:predicted transcriptional regulator